VAERKIRTRKVLAPPLVLAVELGSAALRAALVDEHARVLAKISAPFMSSTTRGIVMTLARQTIELAHVEARGKSTIRAIGVSVPGQLDPQTQRVTFTGWRNWTRVPLGQLLERELTKTGYDIRQSAAASEARAELRATGQPPIIVSSRLAALAAAESWVGAARGKQHMVYVEVGETIECAILLNGRAWLGASGLAGAAGWQALAESFQPDYATQGCLNAEGAKGGLVRRAIEEYSGDARTMIGSLIREAPEQLTPEMIVRAARGGEQHARKIVSAHCRWLGRGLANLISLLNPEVIVLGGELSAALKPFLDDIRDEARLWALPDAAHECRILLATVDRDAALLGAARLAMQAG
jgi:glucokinase